MGIWINGGLMVILAGLYLFVKPSSLDRRNSKPLLLFAGLLVAGFLVYLARGLHVVIAVAFYALATAVAVKVFLNWREISGR